MTYENHTSSTILTGRLLHFPKGTPIYDIKPENVPIGGRSSLRDYYKTGKTLSEEFEVPETKININYVVPYKNQGVLMHKDSIEAQKSRKKTFIIFSLIAAAIICIITYKRKHK